MLAHMLVGACPLMVKKARVVARQARHDLEERARHEQLSGPGEAHDALRDVDAVADDVELAVQVLHQPHRAEVDTQAHGERAGAVAHRHRGKERVFRVPHEGHRGAVAGIEDDAVARGHLLERLREHAVEFLL